MAKVEYWYGTPTLESPAYMAEAVTPHDTTELTPHSRALYVGTAGNLVVRLVGMDSGTVTFSNAPVGWHPIQAKLVHTDTTASNIVAVW